MAYTGIGSKLQVAKEATWGTLPASMTENISYLSETLSLNVERKEEETLLSNKATAGMDIMAKKVSGDISLLLKPENAGTVFALALGKEAAPALEDGTTGVYKHVFTALGPQDEQPSFSVTIDRKAAVHAYTGLVVDSLKIEAQAGDYVKGTLSVKGRDEVAGSINAALAVPTLKAFRFANGSVTFDGVEYGSVTGANFSFSNSTDDGDQTLSSGYNYTKPLHSMKSAEVEFDVFYDADTNTIREEKYKQEALLGIVLTLESPAEIETGEKYRFEIVIANAVVSECQPNIGGKDKIKLKIKAIATEVSGAEPVVINYYSNKATAY